MISKITEFNKYRSDMNEKILNSGFRDFNKFFALDNKAYIDGALDSKTKELMGLVASMVLRCDDCIKYHLGTCHEIGVTTEEIFEVFSVANLVGGSICIPHTRRATEYWDELEAAKS